MSAYLFSCHLFIYNNLDVHPLGKGLINFGTISSIKYHIAAKKGGKSICIGVADCPQ